MSRQIKYATIGSIPDHIFTNTALTITPNPELRQYLRYMIDNHEDSLEYLWRKAMEYKSHGGQVNLSFKSWKHKLKADLAKQEED